MLHELPIHNVRLLACHEDWARMTPTEQGRHCQRCDREILDFTHRTAAELAAARAAAPDGRVCGRFRRSQLADSRPVRFGLWARAFALALALVFGQGLTAREAWAQTRKAAPPQKTAVRRPAARPVRRPQPAQPAEVQPEIELMGLSIEPVVETVTSPTPEAPRVFNYVEQMPQPPGGPEGLKQYLAKNLRYPAAARQQQVAGKVFVNFIVRPDGQLADPQVLKGIGAGCDEEALRLIRQMPAWTPGRQGGPDGHPVSVSYTLPVVFKLPDQK